MLLLVTGASGVGKSTVRTQLASRLPADVEAVELASLGETPQWSVEWRQRMVERLVQRATVLAAGARHLLVCGDPIPPGEVAAAPSAAGLELSVLLLDASPAVQQARLSARGDPPTLFERHIAFANWMRQHVVDPTHLPEVVIQNGWPAMEWERWHHPESTAASCPPWSTHVVDTTTLDAAAVASEVAAWVHRELAAHAHHSPDRPYPHTPRNSHGSAL
jgi:hypothetical protein